MPSPTAVAFCVAVADSEPDTASNPVPIRVQVVTFESVTATAGDRATSPPAAPMRASVTAASVALAASVTVARTASACRRQRSRRCCGR